MTMLILILMNLIAVAAAALVSFKILDFENYIDCLLSIFSLYFAQIIFSEMLLGLIGALTLSNLIIVQLVFFFLAYVLTKRKQLKKNLQQIPVNDLFSNKVIILCSSIILGFALVKLSINLINPPFGWDSLNYHFTFAVEWLKNANLSTPITISDDPSPSYYPVNGSLYYLWLMLPLKNVFIADLGQLPFFIMSFLAVFNISKKLRLTNESAFYSASLFVIVPNFFKQLQIAYVDLMVAGLFLACVNFLFLLNEDFSRKNALIYSLSLGLLLGTKTTALPYCILLFIPFLYLAVKRKKFRLILLFVLLAVIFGGFSYIRNFLLAGNPLYPLDFRIFGKTIFKGVMENNVYRAHFKTEDYSLAKLFFHEGLGVQSLLILLPGIFLAIPLTLIKAKKTINFNLIYFLILPFLIYLVYRFVIPLANTRYLYPFLGIGIIIGFYAFKLLNIPNPVIKALVCVSCLASISELAKRQELISAIIFSVLLFFFFTPIFKKTRSIFRKPFIIVLLSIVIFISLIYLNKNYGLNEYTRYKKMVKYSGFWPDAADAWNWLNQETRGNNIAYIGRPVPFPLYGTNFKNNVYYVSVNTIEPAKLHFFSNSRYSWGYEFLSLHKNLQEKGNYRFQADYSVWLNNLRSKETDYLLVYSLHQTKDIIFPVEDEWAGAHPDLFKPAFKNNTVHIYKLNLPGLNPGIN